MSLWQILLATHPFPARGVPGANETGSNELQRLFPCSRESLPGGYTSHDFVTAMRVCVITTALQPPSSIYMGLLAVPKVEYIFSLNPLSMISTDLSVGVPAGIHCWNKMCLTLPLESFDDNKVLKIVNWIS